MTGVIFFFLVAEAWRGRHVKAQFPLAQGEGSAEHLPGAYFDLLAFPLL